jgi:hypothetical protein
MLTTSEKKPLTGWLILFMVILGLLSYNHIAREITGIRLKFEPHFSDFPSLRSAVLTYQCLLFGGACAAFYTVWILYQRTPGTLFLAKRSFIVCVTLRIMAPWVFHLRSGLPPEFLEPLQTYIPGSLSLAVYATVWHLYLSKSKRVEEIYTR